MKASQVHVERLENSVFQVTSHLSIFDLFLNLDKLCHTVVDPMHAILEGVLPYYIWQVWFWEDSVDCHCQIGVKRRMMMW